MTVADSTPQNMSNSDALAPLKPHTRLPTTFPTSNDPTSMCASVRFASETSVNLASTASVSGYLVVVGVVVADDVGVVDWLVV